MIQNNEARPRIATGDGQGKDAVLVGIFIMHREAQRNGAVYGPA